MLQATSSIPQDLQTSLVRVKSWGVALHFTPWELLRSSRRFCVCICFSTCASERYFIFQVLWFISVTKISFMTAKLQKWYSFIAKGCYQDFRFEWNQNVPKLYVTGRWASFKVHPLPWGGVSCSMNVTRAPKYKTLWPSPEPRVGLLQPQAKQTPFLILSKKAEDLVPLSSLTVID
jgi:hypothetical protein